LDADAKNLGVGGAVLEAGLAVDPGVDADLITIAFGVNDFSKNVPPGDVLDNGRRLLAVLRSRSQSPVVIFTPLPWRDRERNDAGHHQEAYRDALRSLVSFQDGVSIAEGPDLIPPDARYLPDAVHPNDEGFKVMADRAIPILRNALQQRTSER
jgi:lysophospholipase L1-like esterase